MPIAPGQGVMVSLSSGMFEFYASARDVILNLNLVPFTYQGVPPRSGTIVNNVYLKAMADLRDCRVLAVVTHQWDAESESNFGIAEIHGALERGLGVLIYLVGDRTAGPAIGLPSGVSARQVRTPEEFAEHFAADLTA